MPIPTPIDLKGIKPIPIAERTNKVRVENFARAPKPGASFSDFLSSLPNVSVGRDFVEFVEHVVGAAAAHHTIAIGIGGHVVKCGLAPVLIDLMERGIISSVAMNGATAIHDTEIAMIGGTSEDVATNLENGTFGMAGETADFINHAVQQNEVFGDAIMYAERFVAGAPFVVALGDAIIQYRDYSDLLRRLMGTHLKYNVSATIAVEEVPDEELGLYGVVKPKEGEDLDADSFEIDDVIEKPSIADAPSHYAIAARYVFSPIIFRAIRQTAQAGGEVGLSHAIRQLMRMGAPVRCVKLKPEEKRYDIGNHETYFKTFIRFALRDEECGPAIREYIRKEMELEG